ncbi:MAG TPA: DUF692 family protein [Solirubrobacterales bacterium]
MFGPANAVDAPKLIHGVGFPVAGTSHSRVSDLEPYLEAVHRSGAPWASEHLSFNQARDGFDEARSRGYFGGFLLPPIQSPQAVKVAAANIRAVKNLLPVPFAFETGVNYFGRLPGEMTDGAFFSAIAEESDCGILLDLHNLWCNERNGRQAVLDVLAELPLDRVWEVHLAGGSEVDGLWLDSHAGAPPEPLYDLAEKVLPLLPNLGAVVFEVTPEMVGRGRFSATAVLDQLRRIRGIWERTAAARAACTAAALAADMPEPTGSRPRISVATVLSDPGPEDRDSEDHSPAAEGPTKSSLPDPARWESVVASLAAGIPVAPADDGGFAETLGADRAVPTLQRLVASFRSGVVATALPLTFRMIMFAAGEEGFNELMRGFWRENTPRRFPAEELDAFLDHLEAGGAAIPHLAEVAAYEMAVRRVAATDAEQRVRFTCEPVALLGSLARYEAPQPGAPGEYEVVVKP